MKILDEVGANILFSLLISLVKKKILKKIFMHKTCKGLEFPSIKMKISYYKHASIFFVLTIRVDFNCYNSNLIVYLEKFMDFRKKELQNDRKFCASLNFFA